jgi:NodT family efflux transporter outer membrane factor (OMF) lipoprotein
MTTPGTPTVGGRIVRASFLTLVPVFLVSGCTTVGPTYEEPTAKVAEDWHAIETETLESDPPVDPQWWKSAFEDPILDGLVETAIEENLSLRSAALRVLQARQQLAIAVGNRYPQQQQLGGQAQTTITTNGSDELFNLGFNVSWEVDFWGRYKLAAQSAAAQLDASIAGYDGVMVSLIADVAKNYLAIRTYQKRLTVASHNLELQKESVRITTAKFDAGAVSSLDVNQAETLLHSTRAQVVSFELSLQQTKNVLAILLGRPPQDLSDLLGGERPIPSLPAEIAVGMPQELIRRRPDIRASERRLAAQGANIGIAVAELYPHFTIGGSIGTTSIDLSGLSNGDNAGLNLFGFFKWNIFNYGRLKSNIRLQDAVFQQLLVDYRDTVLQAQADVENSIVAYLKSQEQLANQSSAAAAAQRAANISSIQYEDGLVDFNTVITTLRSLQVQQDVVATTRGRVANNLVQVYRSLGGGWETRGEQAPDALLPEETKDEMRNRVKAWNVVFDEPEQ